MPERAIQLEPIRHGRKRRGLGTVMSLPTVAPMLHQLRPLQHGQVLGHSRLRDIRISGECMHCLLALPNQLFEDSSSRGIGKGTKDVIGDSGLHRKTITMWLLVVNSYIRIFPTLPL
jgi:hypothetical protein